MRLLAYMHIPGKPDVEALSGTGSDVAKALIEASRGKPRHVGVRDTIRGSSEGAGGVILLLRGWIGSFKHLSDGRWQIVSFYLPGDLFQIDEDGVGCDENSLRAMTDCIVHQVSARDFESAVDRQPRLAAALRRSQLSQASGLREWIASLGQRTARERCAHLICQLFWRLRAADQAKGGVIDFPLTQEEVGGTIGVSTVHANRVLQDLRGAGLIEQTGKRLKILDLDGLEQIALFSPNFLQLKPDRAIAGPLDRYSKEGPAPARSLRDRAAPVLRPFRSADSTTIRA